MRVKFSAILSFSKKKNQILKINKKELNKCLEVKRTRDMRIGNEERSGSY